MSELKLHLFGRPRLAAAGAPLDFTLRKGLALLAYLAVSGQSHSREALATLLWPESASNRALAALRSTLWALNKTAIAPWLRVDQYTVALPAADGLWVDVLHLRQLVAECATHNHSAHDGCPACLPLLSEAAALYQADFLTGFTLRDSAAFDEWQFLQTETLRQEAAQLLERLVRLHQSRQDPAAAIPYARRWLALDPLHEPAHRQLMLLYAQHGQQAAALRQYELCVDTLKSELGLPPSAETTGLYEQIRSGQWHAEPISAPAKLIIKNNLSSQTTPFIGRQTELAELARLLANPAVRLVTILGPGGSGKTRLALEVAALQLNRFEHGVFFVQLGPLGLPQSIIPAIAEALNFSFYEGAAPEQQLHSYLREKQLLLVMDNYEHLLASPDGATNGAEIAAALLKVAPGLKIMATSRASLNLQEEQRFPLSGIDFHTNDSAGDTVDVASQSSAVQLFALSAQRVRPDFALSDDNLASVARICRRVEGMPLAIILAAAWVELLMPAEIAEELERSLDFLESELRDLPARQQSMRAVFNHSWQMLSEPERQVFQQASVFRGGFTRHAAEAVTGASLRTLRGLISKSFLQVTPTGRYEVHELLRQFGAEKLEQSVVSDASERENSSLTSPLVGAPLVGPVLSDAEGGTEGGPHHRHSAYFCAFLQQRESDLKGFRQQEALAEIEIDSENIRAAWEWATRQKQIEQLEPAMASLGLFCDWRGRFQEGESAFHIASEQLSSRVENLPILAKLLTWQALFCRRLGQIEQARQLFQQALNYLHNPALAGQDTRPEQVFVCFEFGEFMYEVGIAEARPLLEQSLVLGRSLGNSWAVARALTMLGGIAWSTSRYQEAQQQLRESLALQQELGDQRSMAQTLNLLGVVARHQGQLEEAERLQRQNLKLIKQTDDRVSIAQVHIHLGSSLLWLGRFSEGILHIEKALAIFRDLGHRHGLIESTDSLSEAKQHLGQYDQVLELTQVLLSLQQNDNNQFWDGINFLTLGQISLTKKAIPEAWQQLENSIAILRQRNQKVALGYSLATLGGLASQMHQFQQAQEYLLEPLRIALQTKAFFLAHVTLAFVALYLTKQNQPEQAIEIYSLASRFPYVGNSRWFEEVTGQYIAAVAEELPPEVASAAKARGRARDLWQTAEELLAKLL